MIYSKKPSDIILSMRTDVLLINSPPWGIENPPVALGFLSRYLREKGISIKVMDLNIEFYRSVSEEWKLLWHVENKNFWARDEVYPFVEEIFENLIEESAKEIVRINPKLLGFSVVDGKERITISLIRRIRDMGAKFPIILGGPSSSTKGARRIFIENIGDEILGYVVGEGEETLLEVAKRVIQGKDIYGVKGILFKKDNKWFYKERQPIEPLDTIPFPDYEDFDLKVYPSDELLVEWSRGCIGRCAFCKNPRLVRGYRYHEPIWVVDEISHHVENLGIRKFTVVDNLLDGYLPQLEGICDLILMKGLDIKWTGQFAPRRDIKENLLRKMRDAGCYKLQIGMESGSRKVLRKMRKFYTPEDSEKVVRMAKNVGLGTEIFVMIGFPGEGEKEFYETYDFIERNAQYIDKIKSINTLHLMEDTDVYENHERYNITLPKDNWHYLWWTGDGNDYEVRKRRGEILLKLAWDLGISVQETNLKEGKEREIKSIEELKESVNSIQKLAPEEKEPEIIINVNEGRIKDLEEEKRKLENEINRILSSKGWKVLKKIVRIKRGLILTIKRTFLLPKFLFILFLTFFVESYLIFLKRVRKILVFPE